MATKIAQAVNRFGQDAAGDFLDSHTSVDRSTLINDPDVPSGNIEFTENTSAAVDVSSYATATVNVPQPSGKVTITENGENIDIAQYATADVNIAQNYAINTNLTVSEGTLSAATTTVTGDVVVEIPNTVTTIGNDVFKGNTLITAVNIPVECTTFGTDVFDGCTNLADIYYGGTQAQWETITGLSGAGVPAGATIHYTEPEEQTET